MTKITPCRRINVRQNIFEARFKPAWMQLNYAAVQQAMVQGVRDYFQASGKKTAVIGLSGGIDSALAAWTAAQALGPRKVIGVSLPYQRRGLFQDNPDVEDAALIADQLQIEFQIKNITRQTDATAREAGLDPAKPDLSDEEKSRLGNIKARQRMILLYDLSAQRNGLVIGTGNKSEITVGYCTLYGDTACAINPLGALYKTQIFELAGFIPEIPQRVIDRVPSAGLFAGQTDEGQLGFRYAELDPLSFLLFDQRLSPEQVAGFGFTRNFIQRVIRMHEANSFKFRMPAVISVPHPRVKIGGSK